MFQNKHVCYPFFLEIVRTKNCIFRDWSKFWWNCPNILYPSCEISTTCYVLTRLRLAFKWLIRAFSGYLSSEQVLLLWDRVLAYNSMDILAVLAVAIFSFRRSNLVQVQTFNAAEVGTLSLPRYTWFIWFEYCFLLALCVVYNCVGDACNMMGSTADIVIIA